LNKEEIAERLGVDEEVIKQEFLIKSVEDRKLTFEQYQKHHFVEPSENVSVRKVKIKKKKTKKEGQK
jgi:hypothetical protein